MSSKGTTATVDEQQRQLAVEMAAGLRSMAAFVEANPQLAEWMVPALQRVEHPASTYLQDPAEELADFARRGLAAGAKVSKQIESDKYFQVELSFGGGVVVRSWTMRDRVCERVVVGTETVTKKVKDPEALAAVPEVEVTEEVEQVEWRCKPLLAAAAEGASAEAGE